MIKWMFFLAVLCATQISADPIKVLAFSGSLNKNSVNNKLVKEAALQAKQLGANVTVIDLKDFSLPFYDADLEAAQGLPANAKRLRDLMKQSDIVIIASPEYNASITGVLKNVLDWSSRNEQGQPSRDAFKGKKFVLLSASPGQGGGTRGLVHLKAIIQNIGGDVQETTFSLPNAYDAFDAQGLLKDPTLKAKLKEVISPSLKAK